MQLLTWNDVLSVNIEEIDVQHKRLVDLINELYRAMKEGKSREIIGNIIQELISYTKIHFGTEEKYMHKFEFSEFPAHKWKHEEFISKVADFESKFNAGKLSVSMEVMIYLTDWLVLHIQGMDKEYSNCFHQHGLN